MTAVNQGDQFIGKELGPLSQGVLFQGVSTAASVGYSTNLSAVGVVQGDNALMLVSNPRWYPFSRVLIVKSASGEFNDIPTSDLKAISEVTKGQVAKKVNYYSGFLGMIDFEGKKYLILAKEVSIHMFYEYDPVLQTCSIKAIDLADGSVHEALSSQLNELVGQNGYFTFKTNITQRLTASTHKQKYNHQMFWAGACFFEQVKKCSVSKDWDLHFTLGSFEQIALKHKSSDLKVTMAARKSVLDSNKLPFIFESVLLGDSTNYVIHEVIVEYEEQKWMLCYTTSNPSLFRLQDIDPSVLIPRDSEKVCEEVKSHIRYTNNTHSGTNWWFVISDKQEATQDLMSEVIQVAINSNSGDKREVYDVSLQDLKKEIDVRPISFSGAVHSIYEILGTSNVVDLKKYPHALNQSKDVLDNHLHYLLLQKTQVGCSQVHLMMFYALLLRGLGIADLADEESLTSVQQMVLRMQKRLYGHVEEVIDEKDEQEVSQPAEDPQSPLKSQVKADLEEVIQSTSLNRTTPTTADALKEARSDGGCFQESRLSVMVFTWDVRSYKPEDPILLKEFLHQFDKTQLPGVVTICLQSVIESSGLKGALGVFKGEDKHLSRWSTLFTTLMQMVDASYSLDSQEMMIGLITLNFVHSSISKQVSKTQIHEIKSGMKGLLGTKGSLVTSFCFKDKLINLCNTHLHGGSDYEKREKKLADIIDTYAHAKRGPDALVLTGNFNFKLFSKTPLKTHVAGKAPGEPGTMWADWQAFDEVSCGMHPNLKLRFKEAPITFASTVGIDPKAPKLVYAEDAIPAWYVLAYCQVRESLCLDFKKT